MKKILLTTIVTAAISTSTFADIFNSPLYIKGDLLASQFNNVKVETYKHKEKLNAAFDVGLGISVIDNIRTELVYTHILPAVFKRAKSSNETHVKAYADAIMVRGVIDLVDLDITKLFAGVGVGGSRIRHKITYYNDESKMAASSKYKYNFAYSAILGASFELTNRAALETGYIYTDYGKTKGLKASVKEGQVALRSHSIFLGIRYEL